MVQRTAAREGRDGKGKNKVSSREEEYVVYEVEDEGESEDAESDRTGINIPSDAFGWVGRVISTGDYRNEF